jgi:ribosome maturation factor RimP
MSPRFLSMPDVTEQIYTLLEPLLEGTDIFIVNIKVKPVNNIKVYLDADGGFSIEKCSSVNRRLYAQIEATGMFPDGDFSLEVSSPGIEEPLTQKRQYKKNTGRKVTVTDLEGKEKTGIMKEVTDEHIVLEMTVGKHKETTSETIPFTNIKKTVVQVIF